MACLQGSSSSSTGDLLAPEKPPLTAGRGASQGGPKAPASAVSCLGKAKVGAEGVRQGRRRACGGYWMRHRETGLLVPARCNSYLCPDCSPLHQMTARLALEQGLVRRFLDLKTETVVFLTFTDTAEGAMDLPALRRRWDNTRRRLQRMWGATDYALVVERQARGALHPHVCIQVDPHVAAELLDRRSRSSYRRRMHELRPAAESLGWGQMVDAVTVSGGDFPQVSRYAAKSLSGYATKEAKAYFKSVGAKRIRPVRLSRGWFPGGLTRARDAVLARERMSDSRLQGTWERVRTVAC